MKLSVIACCCSLLLGACASVPLPPAPPAPVVCPPPAEVLVSVARPDQALDALLAFQASVRQLKAAELPKALAASEAAGADAPLRRALVLGALKDEAYDKLALQLREAQRRNEQLSEKLEALKNIERNLSAPVPAPPK